MGDYGYSNVDSIAKVRSENDVIADKKIRN